MGCWFAGTAFVGSLAEAVRLAGTAASASSVWASFSEAACAASLRQSMSLQALVCKLPGWEALHLQAVYGESAFSHCMCCKGGRHWAVT